MDESAVSFALVRFELTLQLRRMWEESPRTTRSVQLELRKLFTVMLIIEALEQVFSSTSFAC